MSYWFNRASSTYLELVSQLNQGNGPKVSLFAWGKSNNVTADQAAIAWSRNDGTSGVMRTGFMGAQASDPIWCRVANSASAANAASGAYVANRWTPTVSRIISDTSRYVWKDFTLSAQNTTNISVTTPRHVVNLGCFWSNGSTRAEFFDGYLAEAGIVLGDVTPNECHLYSMGVPLDELFPSTRLLIYLPLHKDTGITDLSQYRHIFTNGGALPINDHPPIIRTPKRRYYLVSAPSGAGSSWNNRYYSHHIGQRAA